MVQSISYANTQFSGTVPSVHDIDENGEPARKTANKEDVEIFKSDLQKKTTLTFFKLVIW
jgi:hypothetical protein